MIFDVAGEVLRSRSWLREALGAKNAGKLIVLGSFFALMAVHAGQAALWGVFLHRTKLLQSVTEGVYFSAASVTTLGYGDILLKYPWRHIGTLIAITGVLMFGCSTAFLFLVLQSVWQHS
ncbi:two pore domain potassium channel family protein [Tropicimonas sp. IMCC6043]|nr:two pore domain potassium channel family protein [Tropicimonas sp. IMCC6043]